MVNTKLLDGEQYLIQTVDKKLALTTHRVIQRFAPWTLRSNKFLFLEDIEGWKVKATGNSLYLFLSLMFAFGIYFDDSFALLSGFFITLFLMTRHRRIHIISANKVLVLPLEVEESRAGSLIEMVRQAQQERISKLKQNNVAPQPQEVRPPLVQQPAYSLSA
ncbi:hypothetical protein I2I11_00635 [Pontibacter sp. 172403-2]|uniref:hypothetical protein n=1 Tax=Pontibacter rufus TaxID=2791028 RepID=UPI0018AFEDE3|nr:hypothetical protein [Pontibacter sp. 172403-2]MBF9251789.1 hypothetical protein [Pontibacter sp. 172403-2]